MLCLFLCTFCPYGGSVRVLFDYNCVYHVSLIVCCMIGLNLSPLISSISILPDLIGLDCPFLVVMMCDGG